MHHFHYLLVGGGIAADAAARGIRDRDPDGTIGVIGAEPHPPYDRPPLSKELWKGGSPASIWRGTAELGVEMFLGRQAEALEVDGKRVTDDQGAVYTFDKLLIATGGVPRRLPHSPEEIIYFRTLDDYTRLRELAVGGGRFVVIGGGWIGPEIAAALRSLHRDVKMILEEEGIGGRKLPADLARHLTEHYRSRGVEVWPGTAVTSVRSDDGHLVVATRSDRTLRADVVVAGLGIDPEVRLARAAGLPVRDGILVDEWLRAGHPDIYAAGDVANFASPVLGKRMRVEHEDAANTMGWHAGQNMAGASLAYRHLPYFYSELFEIRIEAVGELDPAWMAVAYDWIEPRERGAVYYLRAGRVRGVLLWNLPARLKRARRLLEEPGPFTPEALRGRLTG